MIASMRYGIITIGRPRQPAEMAARAVPAGRDGAVAYERRIAGDPPAGAGGLAGDDT